jgi:hypothetical protein
MNGDQVAALRDLLAPTGWLDQTWYFGRALRDRARTPAGLLVVGSPAEEPWHMTAHLAEESRLAGLPGLAPTLVRWAPRPGAPPHLSAGIERLETVRPDETLLVVTAAAAPEALLSRLADARRAGSTIFALDTDDPDLDGLAHEALAIQPATAPVSFDAAQHLVTAAAGEARQPVSAGRDPGSSRPGGPGRPGRREVRGGLRGRLAHLLDTVSGTPAGWPG